MGKQNMESHRKGNFLLYWSFVTYPTNDQCNEARNYHHFGILAFSGVYIYRWSWYIYIMKVTHYLALLWNFKEANGGNIGKKKNPLGHFYTSISNFQYILYIYINRLDWKENIYYMLYIMYCMLQIAASGYHKDSQLVATSNGREVARPKRMN